MEAERLQKLYKVWSNLTDEELIELKTKYRNQEKDYKNKLADLSTCRFVIHQIEKDRK